MTGRRLLVIDDEPQFAAIVRKVAEEMGYQVAVAGEAGSFKASFLALPPAVVVLDIVMPDVDGIELMIWLIEQQCRAEVILVTGYSRNYAAMAKIIAEARGAMRVSIMEKPVKLAELRAALTRESPA